MGCRGLESQAERSHGRVTGNGRQWRLAIAVIIASAVVRLVVAAWMPLFPDEAYYWQWSRHLADGYFDHPPAIAWLVRAGTALAGDTPLGVRLGPVVAGLATMFILCAAARRIGGDRAALIAALATALMPLSAAGLVLATPDAPLLAATAAMLYAVIRALEAPARSSESDLWWVLAGVALGVAEASKYTAVLIPLAAFSAMAIRRDLRPRLQDPGPYIATLVSLVVFSPVIAWNAEHGWASFAFQLKHGLGHVDGSIARRELELLGGQIALVSPILFALLCFSVAKVMVAPVTARSHARASSTALLTFVAALVFMFFAYSATKRRVEANWPAIAYIPGMLVLATHAGGRVWNLWLKAGLALTAGLSGVVYVNTFVPILRVPAHRDPVARSAGWNDVARAVERALGRQPPGRAWVAADRYQEASLLAFNLAGQPGTFALNLTTRANQYDLWPAFPERARIGDALVLVTGDPDPITQRHTTIDRLAPHFASVRRGEQVVLARNGEPVSTLRVWLLEQWRGSWP